MSKILNDNLIYEILSVVEEIPYGRAASYGQIARLIGRDKNHVSSAMCSAVRNFTEITRVTVSLTVQAGLLRGGRNNVRFLKARALNSSRTAVLT